MGKKIIKTDTADYVQLEKVSLLATDGTNTVEVVPIEYIKGNGTSTYINLGIIPKSNTNVEIVAYQENDYLGGDRVLIGGGTSWNNNTEFVIGAHLLTQHFFEKGTGGVESGTTQLVGVKNTYKIQDNKAYINGVVKYTFTNTTINTSNQLYLFALNRSAVSPSIINFSNARMYSCKLWEGTVLKLDLIPVKYGTEYCLLDLVEMKLYHNNGTGAFTGGNEILLGTPVKQLSTQKAGWLDGDTFTTFPVVEAGPAVYTSRLKGAIETLDDGAYKVLEGETPKKVKLYEKLKYIESTDTDAYVDLGVMSTGVRWELDYQFLSEGQIGCGNDNTNRFLIQSDNHDDLKFHFWLGTTFATDVDSDFERHNFILDANEKVGILDGKSYSYPAGVVADTISITLFARHQLGSETYGFRHKAKCFSCKITKNGVTTVFTPAKRLTDNKYGLLDEVNMIFYPGVGTITGESYTTAIYIDADVEKIEYIQANGTERLDLGTYTFNSSTDKIETVFKFNKLSSTTTATWLYSCETSSSASIDFYSQSNGFHFRPSPLSSIGTHDTNKHKFILDYLNNTYSWDTTTGTPGGQGTSVSAPLVLFRRASRGGDAPAEINLYSFMIFKNNVKQFDLRPVKLGGTYCFYDTVSKEFKFLTGSNIKGGTKTLEVERVSDNVLGFYNVETHTFTEASIEKTPYEREIDKDNLAKFKVNDVEYKKLEYISTTNNSIIDTGVTVKKNITKLEIDCNITTSDNNHQIGCGGSDTDVIFFTRGFVYLLTASQGGTAYSIPINERKKYIADAVNNKIGYEGNLISLTPTANQSKDTFTIGARKHNGVYELQGTDIIYDFKAYENNVLIKHLIPVQRTSDNVIGMLDTVNNVFYTNVGTGTLTAGPTKGFDIDYQTIEAVYDEGILKDVKQKKIKLPEYQVLDYIENIGTSESKSYIDVGLTYNNIKRVVCSFINTSTQDVQYGGIFGAGNSERYTYPWWSYSGNNNGNAYIPGNFFANINTAVKFTIGHRYECDATLNKGGKNTLKITTDTGNVYSYTSSGNNPANWNVLTENCTLFRNGNYISKVYTLKLYDHSNVLVRDYIPVKRLSDNVIGMYDKVSKTLFTNAGTGSFTAGTPTGEFIYNENPDIVTPVEYIEKNVDGPYINLNISNHNYKNFGYETDIYVLKKDNGTWPALYGSLSGTNYDGTGNYSFYLHSTDNQVSARAGTGNGQIGNHSATTLLNNWCNVIYNRVDTLQELTINGNKQTRTGGNNGGTNLTPFLFCVNNGSGIVHDFQARIRKFKAYENGLLVRDFIPVKYNTEYCLLDLVEMKLYHNAGTNSFTGPEDITTYTGKYERLCYADINRAITDDKLEDSFDIKIRALKPDTYISGAIKIYSDGIDFKVNDGSATEQVLDAYDNEEHRIVYDKKNGKLYFNAKAFNVASREGIVNVTNCRLVDYKSFKDTELTSLIFPVNLNEGKGLLDIINNEIIYPSTITGDREVRLKYISDVHDNVAPKYEECDYIESNGTQYIDTNVKLADVANFDITFSINTPSTTQYLFGTGIQAYDAQNLILGVNGSNLTWYDRNNQTTVLGTCVANTFYSIKSENGSVYLNGVDKASFTKSTSTSNMILGAYYAGGSTISSFMSGKIKNFKLTLTNGSVIDLIPVYNRELADYGMYDKVTGTYYGNAGTGSFTGQRKSNPEYINATSIIPVEYIEATGTQFIDTGLTSVSTYDIGGTITAPYTESGYVYLFKDSSGVIPGNILYAKLYNNGTLVRDYQPVLDLSNNETCLYDKVNDVLYRNQGTGKFNHGPERIIKMDPAEVKVSYLESTGTQYIDTGLTSAGTYEIEGTITEPIVESGHVYLFKGKSGNITSAKFFDSSNALVRYFIPVIRTRDLKSGMYCIVTNTFCPNVGSGEFIAGKII